MVENVQRWLLAVPAGFSLHSQDDDDGPAAAAPMQPFAAAGQPDPMAFVDSVLEVSGSSPEKAGPAGKLVNYVSQDFVNDPSRPRGNHHNQGLEPATTSAGDSGGGGSGRLALEDAVDYQEEGSGAAAAVVEITPVGQICIKSELDDMEEDVKPQQLSDADPNHKFDPNPVINQFPTDHASITEGEEGASAEMGAEWPQEEDMSMMTGGGELSACDYCGFVAESPKALRRHKRIEHGVAQYECDRCDYVTHRSNSMKRHKIAKHKEDAPQLTCDECDYTTYRMDRLKHHKGVKHDGVRYNCDHCSYSATAKFTLKLHVEKVHELLRYFCEECDYFSMTRCGLKQHIQSKHQGIVHNCTLCSFKTKSGQMYRNHLKKNHPDSR